jgi:hypothetical protein
MTGRDWVRGAETDGLERWLWEAGWEDIEPDEPDPWAEDGPAVELTDGQQAWLEQLAEQTAAMRLHDLDDPDTRRDAKSGSDAEPGGD